MLFFIWLERHEATTVVLYMKIGPPLANATLEGGVWRRQFQHVNVT